MRDHVQLIQKHMVTKQELNEHVRKWEQVEMIKNMEMEILKNRLSSTEEILWQGIENDGTRISLT